MTSIGFQNTLFPAYSDFVILYFVSICKDMVSTASTNALPAKFLVLKIVSYTIVATICGLRRLRSGAGTNHDIRMYLES